MKKPLAILAVLLLMGSSVLAFQAGTRTTNLNLFKPDVSSVNWGAEINLNFDTLDSVLSGTADAFGLRPNASGNDLGSTTRRWDAFLQDVDILSTADTSTGARALLLIHSDAIAGAGAHPFRLVHNTSGTPVNGIGAGIRFDAETTTTESVEIGDLNFIWVNATHGIQTGAITFFLVDNAAAPAEVSRITSVGDYQWNSGTSFTGLLAHANTVNRTYTFSDGSGNVPSLPTAATTETGTGAIVRAVDSSVNRVKTNGTALVAGDIAIVTTGAWGDTANAVVSAVTGNDQWFQWTITAGGANTGANPTIVITFTDGTWTTAPIVMCNRQDFAVPATVTVTITTVTATVLTLTFDGTPTAANVYRFACHVGGI